MLFAVVPEVATLAEGGEVARPVIRRVVIAVRRGQHNTCRGHLSKQVARIDAPERPPLPVSPPAALRIASAKRGLVKWRYRPVATRARRGATKAASGVVMVP